MSHPRRRPYFHRHRGEAYPGPRRRRIRLATLSLFAIVAAAGLSTLASVVFTGRLRRPAGPIPSRLSARTSEISFPARDGTRLSGWLIQGDGAGRAAILLHGHGATREQMVGRADFLSRQGYAVLLYDARAQGASQGNRISVGWYETSDLLGALDFMRTRGFKSFGRLGASQGGATILLAADRLPPGLAWVVVESSYPNLRDAIDRRFQAHLGLPGPLTDFLFILFS